MASRWSAGEVSPCEGGHDHRVEAIHVIVRCACGHASMSTDGRLALIEAGRHTPATDWQEAQNDE